MKFLTSAALFLILCFKGYGQWEQTGGPTGATSREVIEFKNYLIVNGYDGGVFRSSDKGLNWQEINNGLLTKTRCFALELENDTLYLATSRGLFFSADGDAWQLISQDIVAYSLEVSGDEIYAGAASNDRMYYSSDKGKTWVMRYPFTGNLGIKSILKFDDTLWIGTGSNVLWSPDNGLNWFTPSVNLVPAGFADVEGEFFMMGNVAGFFRAYRSSDKGSTWTLLLQTQEMNVATAGLAKKGSEIYVTAINFLYYSSNNGASWTKRELPPALPWGKSYVTMTGNDLFVTYGDGILFTPDKGLTWERRNVNYRNHAITSTGKTNDALVAFTENNSAFVSLDQGNHWNAIHDPTHLLPRQIYAYEETIIMSYDFDTYKSIDNGASWQPIFTLTIPPDQWSANPRLAGYENSLVLAVEWGVYTSKDLGGHWDFTPASFGDGGLVKTFLHGEKIVVETREGLFYSSDFGERWEKKDPPAGLQISYQPISDMIIDELFIIASSYHGLYKSPDFGTTWKEITDVPQDILLDLELVGEDLIVCSNSGIFVNRGADWFDISDPLSDNRIYSVTVKDEYAYIGTYGRSVWKRHLSDLLTNAVPLASGSSLPTPLLEVNCKTITVTNPVKGTTIKWYRNDTLIENEAGIRLKATDDDVYRVSFENEEDFKISREVTVGQPAPAEIELYNVVTLNDDDKNEYYFVDDDLVGSRLQVFNRWGQLVYISDAYQNDWMPTEVAAGVYFYSIENECLGNFKGTLTVMKN